MIFGIDEGMCRLLIPLLFLTWHLLAASISCVANLKSTIPAHLPIQMKRKHGIEHPIAWPC